MTTENVAILFTDIVGSTKLSLGLSPDAADEVRRGHFSILRQAIAEKRGTEVKNLGDGVMAVFGSASAALGCAVAAEFEHANHRRRPRARRPPSGYNRAPPDKMTTSSASTCAWCACW